jgi:hypothetical protein
MNYETFQAPDEVPDADHECGRYLEYRSAEWTEGHGERCRDEWWECAVCGDKFTGEELDVLYNRDHRGDLAMSKEKAA